MLLAYCLALGAILTAFGLLTPPSERQYDLNVIIISILFGIIMAIAPLPELPTEPPPKIAPKARQ